MCVERDVCKPLAPPASEAANGDEGEEHFEEGANEGGTDNSTVCVRAGISSHRTIGSCCTCTCPIRIHCVEDLQTRKYE